MKSLLLTIALCSAVLAGQAQTVYRCGPDGRSYADSPCKDGRAVDVADARSAEQARAAADIAQRDKRLANDLRRERHARESEERGRAVVALGPTSVEPARLVAKPKSKKKNAKPPSDGLREASGAMPGQPPAQASAALPPPAPGTSPSAALASRRTRG